MCFALPVVLGANEVKVSWSPVEHKNYPTIGYKLFSGNYNIQIVGSVIGTEFLGDPSIYLWTIIALKLFF